MHDVLGFAAGNGGQLWEDTFEIIVPSNTYTDVDYVPSPGHICVVYGMFISPPREYDRVTGEKGAIVTTPKISVSISIKDWVRWHTIMMVEPSVYVAHQIIGVVSSKRPVKMKIKNDTGIDISIGFLVRIAEFPQFSEGDEEYVSDSLRSFLGGGGR